MSMYILTLADGSEVTVGLCGAYDGALSVQVYLTFPEAAVIFSDKAKTVHMVYDYHAGVSVFDGYTRLNCILSTEDYLTVQLVKEAPDVRAD